MCLVARIRVFCNLWHRVMKQRSWKKNEKKKKRKMEFVFQVIQVAVPVTEYHISLSCNPLQYERINKQVFFRFQYQHSVSLVYFTVNIVDVVVVVVTAAAVVVLSLILMLLMCLLYSCFSIPHTLSLNIVLNHLWTVSKFPSQWARNCIQYQYLPKCVKCIKCIKHLKAYKHTPKTKQKKIFRFCLGNASRVSFNCIVLHCTVLHWMALRGLAAKCGL